jgi:hypothetical protein
MADHTGRFVDYEKIGGALNDPAFQFFGGN